MARKSLHTPHSLSVDSLLFDSSNPGSSRVQGSGVQGLGLRVQGFIALLVLLSTIVIRTDCAKRSGSTSGARLPPAKNAE